MALLDSPLQIDAASYHQLVQEGSIFYELREDTEVANEAFIQAIELVHPKLPDTTADVLQTIERTLHAVHAHIAKCKQASDLFSQLQNLKERVQATQAKNRRDSIKKIFNTQDLQFAKTLQPHMFVEVTQFTPISAKLPALKAAPCSCSLPSLPQMKLLTRHEFKVVAGKIHKFS